MEKAIINIKTDKKKKVDTNIYQMTPKLERLIGRIRKDFKNKKNISGPFPPLKKWTRTSTSSKYYLSILIRTVIYTHNHQIPIVGFPKSNIFDRISETPNIRS